MFKFTTTTILNNNKDFTTGKTLVTYSEDPVPALDVKRHLKFLASNVTHIFKSEYQEPAIASAEIDLANCKEVGTYRLELYIGLEGSLDSYYANDFVYRGKPLFIEFVKKTGEDASKLAEKVVKIAKKYLAMVYEFEVVKIENRGSVIVFTGINPYQRFNKVQLQKYNAEAGVALPMGAMGEYEVVVEALTAVDEACDGVNVIKQGREGFGTYSHLVKDYQVPTQANRRWIREKIDEVPVLGAKYDQYIIYYCKDRGVMGGSAVGDLVKSMTCHVFWVNKADTSLAAAFEAFAAKTPNDLETVEPTDNYDVIVNGI